MRRAQYGLARFGTGAMLALSVACGSPSSENGANRPPPDQKLQPSDSPTSYAWDALIPKTGDFVLVDRQTGSLFNLRGEAFEGPLAANKTLLKQLPGVNMFWFAWSVFFPGSEIWGRKEGVRDSDLPADKTGSVGCGGGKDCIPSLPNTGRAKGDLAWVLAHDPETGYLRDEDLVLGVFRDGVARAYPHNILWWHEIANDHIGDQAFSVTFCPLTGSGLAFAATDAGYSFGVSGQLFNSNLVMYEHGSQTLWPQLWMGPATGAQGETNGRWLSQIPVSEMTWRRWKELHPDSLVLSERTGFSRNYAAYPYGDYRSDHDDTFRFTTPAPDPLYRNKVMTFGLMDRASGLAKAYVHSDLAALGPRAVVNDEFNGQGVIVVHDATAKLTLAFEAPLDRETKLPLSFDAVDYQP